MTRALPTGSDITVVGAGIFGLWQALGLARTGYRVRLLEASEEPFSAAASRLAGAMLLADCEAETMPPAVLQLAHHAISLWRDVYPDLVCAGSLAVVHARDRAELDRLARLTSGYDRLDAARLQALEPGLEGRFAAGLHFPADAHMATPDALKFLLGAIGEAGARVEFGQPWQPGASDGIVIDCRGFAARDDLQDLRGVRGERFVVATDDVELQRPIHLLHPRQSLYVVPWGKGRFLLGATLIESEDQGPVTLRSAVELLGLAYSLHPAFGEAQILESAAGLRPSFPDNAPRAIVSSDGARISVNGSWRHGFLMAPVLAEAVASYLAGRNDDHPLLRLT